MPSRPIDDLLNRLEQEEQRWFSQEFLAPMLHGGHIQVRIAGIVCRLGVRPADFTGWGVFRATSYTEAQLVRPASLTERQGYLNLFPLLRVIFCEKAGDQWLAVPAHQGDQRFRFRGPVPVRLVEEGQLFEVVETRFDGSTCWFDRPDERRDPAAGAYLRQALQAMTEPKALHRPGLTAEERTAYTVAFLARLEDQRGRTEERLRQALAHAGAEFSTYLEWDDCYRVEYTVDGQPHVSVLDKKDLGVQVAGICLAGTDRQFDLQSLVGVIREARDGGRIVRVDEQGINEDDYRRVHPPE